MKFLKLSAALFVFVMAFLVIGYFPTVEPTIAAYASDEGLVSLPATEAPVLDGVGADAVWANAPVFSIETKRGANASASTVNMQSVHTAEKVYFLFTWADPTQSWERALWEMQADGTWKQLKDPEDKGGDNNVWYEDKLALIWNINDSIVDFNEEGCGVACHRSSSGDPKPYGNKFTDGEGQLGDIWHWKSVRNLNQIDDQYLDHTAYSPETPEAGRKSDPKDGGGYSNNITEDKSGPAFMPAGEFAKDGSPGFILDSEKVPFDPTLFQPGDRLPAIIISEITGDRGQIAAGWKWVDGVWTLEFSRDLVTGSEFDVQFDDLGKAYYFGVATFDNAQVRHAMAGDPIALTFKHE